mmetsp:Transcript_36262/g.120036  ORF Transcript_36262/g.120036 Transcript_36262/m.120036 type:complete len:206 (+) Transcript_36262:102-719(+)
MLAVLNTSQQQLPNTHSRPGPHASAGEQLKGQHKVDRHEHASAGHQPAPRGRLLALAAAQPFLHVHHRRVPGSGAEPLRRLAPLGRVSCRLELRVVQLARLWVREELERLGHLLEATLRRLAAGALVPVRVPLLGERLVCRAQLSLPHAPRHAEHLVRVAIVLVACRRGRGAVAAVARKPRRCRPRELGWSTPQQRGGGSAAAEQ